MVIAGSLILFIGFWAFMAGLVGYRFGYRTGWQEGFREGRGPDNEVQ